MDDSELAVLLVTEAAGVAVEMRAGGISAEQKTTTADLVTAADRAAEERIQAILRAERPGDGLTGEEGTSWASGTGRGWVVDPIDGASCQPAGLRSLDGLPPRLLLRADQPCPIKAGHHRPASDRRRARRRVPPLLRDVHELSRLTSPGRPS